MQKDITQCDTCGLKAYLMSSASLGDLGAQTEKDLQHTPDYVQCKEHIFSTQKKLALWKGVGSFSDIGKTLALGFVGASLKAAFDSTPDNFSPTELFAGAGTASALAGLGIFATYQSDWIHTQNNFCNSEAGARKGAEMGKIHAQHNHMISLASSEYTAQRVGQEVENAMKRVMQNQQVPSPAVTAIHTIDGHQGPCVVRG